MASVMMVISDALDCVIFDNGIYVSGCDFEANNGFGQVTFTPDKTKALRFSDTSDALAFWRTVSLTRPVRPDGKPNRPLSMWTLEITNA